MTTFGSGDNSRSSHSQYGQANYNQTGGDIFSNRQVKDAKDIVTIIRGSDGKPQVWSTGPQEQAVQLLRDASQTLNVQEMAST